MNTGNKWGGTSELFPRVIHQFPTLVPPLFDPLLTLQHTLYIIHCQFVLVLIGLGVIVLLLLLLVLVFDDEKFRHVVEQGTEC